MTVKLFRLGDGLLGRFAAAFEMQAISLAVLPVQALPLTAALEVGRAVGRAAAFALPKYRRRAEENLRKAYPEKSEKWIAKTAVESFEHFGQVAAEMVKSPRSPKSAGWSKVVSVPREELLLQVAREGKGAIWVTGHLGNWELAAQWFARHNLKLTSIAHRSRNPYLNDYMTREREARGHSTIDMAGAFRGLIRALRGGSTVALLTDRNPRDTGMLVPFFGRDCLTVTSPALISCATGAPVVPFACMREGKAFRYTVHVSDPIRPDPSKPRDEEVARITRESVAALERDIRRDPGQWQWMHRRWKTTPGGLKRAGIASAK